MKAGCKQRATKGWIPRVAFSHTEFHALGLLQNLPRTFMHLYSFSIVFEINSQLCSVFYEVVQH